MSKRFYAACMAMQGILAKYGVDPETVQITVRNSYAFADELLKQEGEK